MDTHFERDLEMLRREILDVGALVEEAIDKATAAFIQRRPDLVKGVLDGDRTIDRQEVLIEEHCLKILALHQPVANDLRFVVTILKVNNDLERMGDLATNIAERARILALSSPLSLPLPFDQMVDKVREMVKSSLDSLVQTNPELAREVITEDDHVDEMNREIFSRVQDHMREQPDSVEQGVNTLSVSRHLERIADLATNIAQDVVFLVEGEVIRHKSV